MCFKFGINGIFSGIITYALSQGQRSTQRNKTRHCQTVRKQKRLYICSIEGLYALEDHIVERPVTADSSENVWERIQRFRDEWGTIRVQVDSENVQETEAEHERGSPSDVDKREQDVKKVGKEGQSCNWDIYRKRRDRPNWVEEREGRPRLRKEARKETYLHTHISFIDCQ